MKVNLRTRPLREVRKERMIPGVMYGKIHRFNFY